MYAQAQSAITYGPVLHPERTVHFWHDLGCYQFVLNDLGSEQAQHFVRENLGPLLETTGSEDHGELLVTLKELLTGDSAQVIAKKLHIHPQTVAFRKKKIEKCLNVDLDSMETRLKLTIATRLLSFMEKNVRMAHLVV
jgi:sugar diacid utilization regulator